MESYSIFVVIAILIGIGWAIGRVNAETVLENENDTLKTYIRKLECEKSALLIENHKFLSEINCLKLLHESDTTLIESQQNVITKISKFTNSLQTDLILLLDKSVKDTITKNEFYNSISDLIKSKCINNKID